MIPFKIPYNNSGPLCAKHIVLINLLKFVIASLIIISVVSRAGGATLSVDPPKEGVILHTDRDIYITGEYLHFKAYLLSNQTHQQLKSNILYVLLQHESGIVDSSVLMFENSMTDGYFYIHDTLPSGYYELTAYTNWMRNQGEKTFFRKGLLVANRFDNTLSFPGLRAPVSGDPQFESLTSADTLFVGASGHTGRDHIRIDVSALTGRRERVEVVVNVIPELPDATMLSVAVVNNNALTDSGKREGMYADYSNTIKNYTVSTYDFFMENGKYILSGAVTDDGKPLEGVMVVLNTPHNRVNIMYVQTDHHGVFRFLLPQCYSAGELYLTLDPATATPQSTITIFEKTDLRLKTDNASFDALLPDKHRIKRMQDIVKATIAFEMSYMDEMDEDGVVDKDFPVLYSAPELVYYPSDYIPFDDLQDIAREVIPALRIRGNEEDGYRAMLSFATSNGMIPGSPVFFIDGIISYDINPLMYLNSPLIERIEIHNRHWVHGELVFPGIVAVFSNSNEYLKILPELPVTRTRYDLMQKDHTFSPPTHTTSLRDRAKPDLRHVLLWEPNLMVKGAETISFYTGDLQGDYTIHITGVLPNGEVISQQKSFVIK